MMTPEEEDDRMLHYYLESGVADHPANRTAFTLACRFVRHHNERESLVKLRMHMLYSAAMEKYVAFVGVVIEETCVPVMMVMQTELIGDLGLRCDQVCPDPECQVVGGRKVAVNTHADRASFDALVSDVWPDPPDAASLARFYDTKGGG